MFVDRKMVSRLFNKGLKAHYCLATVYFQNLFSFSWPRSYMHPVGLADYAMCVSSSDNAMAAAPPLPHLEPSYSSWLNLRTTSSEDPFHHPTGIPSSLELPSQS